MYYKLAGSNAQINLLAGGYIEIYQTDGRIVNSIPPHTAIRNVVKQIHDAWNSGYSTRLISYMLGNRGDISCINIRGKEYFKENF